MKVFEYVTLDTGTTHLVNQANRNRTLCGIRDVCAPLGDETITGIAATCRRCKNIVRKAYLGSLPREGVDRCACGCKYWNNGRCIDCGDTFSYPGSYRC